MSTSVDGYGSSYISQYNAKGEYPHLRRPGIGAGQLAEPHGNWVDTRGKTPVLVVADRRNNRLQRFTLDGKHIDFIPGFRLPCHFHEHKGLVVVPDLDGRVTLMDKSNALVAQLGDSNPAGTIRCAPSRATSSSRPIHLPARRLLRSRRRHLRRRVGRSRKGPE